MQGDHTSFCVRQFAKMRTLADDTSDPALKGELMRMADEWAALASGPVAARRAQIKVVPGSTAPALIER
jgi:hypothetical protein